MIRVMAWVLRAATIFKGYSFPSDALDAKELARGEALIQLQVLWTLDLRLCQTLKVIVSPHNF